MISIVIAFAASFILVLIATPALIKVALMKRLVDEPDEGRKLHDRRIPTIGGIIIFAATLFSYAISFPTESFFNSGAVGSSVSDLKYLSEVHLAERAMNDFKYIIATVLIMFFVGVKDDIIGTAAMKKLLAHFIVAMILVLMADVRIRSMHGLFGIEVLPDWASIFLSVFTVIVIINAFNLVDGVDGLASGIGLIACIAFGIWFFVAGDFVLSMLAFSLAGAMSGFLIFNFSPAKIFMGDSGSLTIGLIISILAIRLVEFIHVEKIESVFVSEISKPIFVMAVLVYPLLDTLRVFFIRIMKGASPFSADRNHIHHKLLELGFTHRSVAITIFVANIFIISLAIVLRKFPSNLVFVFLMLFCLVLSQVPFLFSSKKAKKNNKSKTIQLKSSHEAKVS